MLNMLYFKASLPITKIIERRRMVLDALLKAKEAGLMELLSKAWLGRTSRGSANDDKDDPSFEAAGMVQVKSVFAALLVGQALAVVVGIVECVIGWPDRRGLIKDNRNKFKKCPYCGKSSSRMKRRRLYSI